MLGAKLGITSETNNISVLDYYPNATVAYSLRKLTSNYTGSAIKVRESGGDTEADIGFRSDGSLNELDLLNHCGSNSGYIVEWYDQSGNGTGLRELTDSATYQPIIVNSGTIVTSGGNPAIEWTAAGEQDLQNTSLGWGTVTAQTTFQVLTFSNTSLNSSHAYMRTISVSDASTSDYLLANNWIPPHRSNQTSGLDIYGVTGADIVSDTIDWNNQALLTAIHTGTAISGFNNGTAFATNQGAANVLDCTMVEMALGMQTNSDVGAGDSHFAGTMQEVIIYNSDKTSDRIAIEINQNNYYNIY